MAGFLDKQERVIDMVLTNEGKILLARGELSFVYFKLFDDEVDYRPHLAESGSLSATELSSSIDRAIEDGLVLEAVTGYRNMNTSGSDFTSVHRPMFTVPQGQKILPRMSASNSDESESSLKASSQELKEVHIQTDQLGKVVQTLGPYDRGVKRADSSKLSLDLVVNDLNLDDAHKCGFYVTVLVSGSEGMVEVDNRRDFQNNVSLSNELVFESLTGGGVKVGR